MKSFTTRRLKKIIPGSYNEERCYQYAVAFLKKRHPQFLDEFENFWKKNHTCSGGQYMLRDIIFMCYPSSFKKYDNCFKDDKRREMDYDWTRLCDNLCFGT